MDAADSLDWLVTMALELGPSGRFVLPTLGLVVGLVVGAVAFALISQRIAWRALDLARALRGTVEGAEVGQPVLVLGRLRAPGGAAASSFERAGRRALVSSLHEKGPAGLVCIATRASPRLELITRHGAMPIDGLLEVRRSRATRAARDVDARAAMRASVPPSELRAVDLDDGQWVLASGRVGRVVREGLREQAGVLGLSGTSEPVVLTALRPELPRGTFAVAALGALVAGVLATPLPWGQALIRVEERRAWCVVTALRLLGPTREVMLASIPYQDVTLRQWALMAARERGDCATEARILIASRDPSALETTYRCESIEGDLRRAMVRDLEDQWGHRAWRGGDPCLPPPPMDQAE